MPGEVLNISTMSGEDVEIKQGSRKKKRLRTVFVTNIPEIDDVETVVRERLETCGNIVDVKASDIQTMGGTTMKRVAVVFSKEEEADKAVSSESILLEGRHSFVSKAHQYTPSLRTVVVSNLSPDVIEEDLWQSFKDCGPISYIGLVWNSKNSIDAQIYFQDESGAKKALQQKNKLVKGNVVSLSRPIFEISNKAHDPVVVTEVSEGTQKEDVEKEFSQYGPILRVKFNRSRTSAFIFYENQKSADKAVKHSGRAEYRFKLMPDVLGRLNPVYIAGAPKEAKDVDIFLKFQVCGLIHGISQDKGNRNFIIQFKEPKSVKKALALEDLSIHGHNVRVGTSVDIFNAPAEAVTTAKALKRKPGQMEGDECDNASDDAVDTSLSSKRKKKKKVTNDDDDVNTSFSSKSSKTKEVTDDAVVDTSLSSKAKKKKKKKSM
ncbi:uncharacterized protein LOC117640661 [Thrips palmi]|uniref:Uncharacterized protein LOC117640661 n=1 Tax=Thrips palmi TaxID=161013 RepID=A0A6P8YHA3_THRPL|nr:uncharacterized protein LOC117640661 [Thrips palmi]